MNGPRRERSSRTASRALCGPAATKRAPYRARTRLAMQCSKRFGGGSYIPDPQWPQAMPVTRTISQLPRWTGATRIGLPWSRASWRCSMPDTSMRPARPQAVDHRIFVHGAPDIAPQPVHRRVDRAGVGRLGAQRRPHLAGARLAFRVEAAGEIGDRGARIRAHVDRHRPHGIVEHDFGAADHGVAQPVAAGDPAPIGVAEEPAQWGRRRLPGHGVHPLAPNAAKRRFSNMLRCSFARWSEHRRKGPRWRHDLRRREAEF